MQNVAFIDETLDRNLTHTYHLSIQAGLSGLSFCILDPVTNKFIVLFHQDFEKNLSLDDILLKIEKLIQSNDLLHNKKYKASKLIWLSEKNTLIPEPLFSKDNLKSHIEFLHQLDDLDEIHFAKMPYLEAYTVYIIPNLVANLFKKYFPEIKFYNQQQILLNGILNKSIHGKTKVTVFVHNECIDVAITEAHKLLLLNNYKCKSDADIAYYLLLLFDQFNLSGENNELVLSGFIDRNSKAYTSLQKYINHIRFDRLPEENTYSYTFSKTPSHMFSNLFRLVQCE